MAEGKLNPGLGNPFPEAKHPSESIGRIKIHFIRRGMEAIRQRLLSIGM
jgi:hypothetical protein